MGVASQRSFDNGSFMVFTLGTMWNTFFPERSTLDALMTARGEPFWQVYLNLLDLVACKSRFNVPVFQKKYWSMLTVKESQKDSGDQLYNLYRTGGLEYSKTSSVAYGDKENSKHFSYAIDSDIKHVHAVYNRVIDPSLIWLEDADFAVDGDRHIISFYNDPFLDPLVPKRDILDSAGNVVDREIALWLNFASWDMQYIYEQFGYAMGVWMKSSTFYREFISAIWDSLVVGTTQVTLKLAFSALTGIPFARGAETVVSIIDESPVYKHVETDQNIYTFKASASILVTVGQELHAGDALVDSVLFYEPRAGDPLPVDFIGLALGPSLGLNAGFSGPIVFDNAEVAVRYLGLDVNNKAIARFDVSGFPKDVDSFWSRSHTEGLRTGVTMADALDSRVVRSSPTTPADLPSSINPAQFALDHIFANNMYLIHINPADFAAGSPGLGALDMLYPYLVPHTTYMIFVETEQGSDYYNVVDQTDTLSFFKGTSVSEQAANDFAVDLGPVIKVIPGRCR